MNEDKGTVLEALGQVQTEEVGKVFRDYLRGVTEVRLKSCTTYSAKFGGWIW